MSQSHLEIMVEDEGYLFARMGPIAALLWFQTPTTERVRRVVELLGTFPEDPGFGLMTVVTSDCTPVGPDIRGLFDEGLRANRDALIGTATVIQVKGVLGGLTRAIARTMGIISRVDYPNNIYATVEEAARWLPELLATCDPPPPSSEQILAAIGPKLKTT